MSANDDSTQESFGCGIEDCDESFDSKQARGQHWRWEHPNQRPWRDEEKIREEYVEKKNSTAEIADKFGCSTKPIFTALEDFGIERRSDSEASVQSSLKEHPHFRTLPNGYETAASKLRGEQYQVYIHRLLAVAEFGFGAVCGMDVHHGAGVEESTTPWDNRPENIDLMGRGDHTKHHQKISKSEMISELKRMAEEQGEAPTTTEMDEHGKYSYESYRREFGSWGAALEAAGTDWPH